MDEKTNHKVFIYYDNKHTILGYKGAFRTIKCASIDGNEFRGV